MALGKTCNEDPGGKYILIGDEEDPRLEMFNRPLPCFGCGIGWLSLLLGCICPLMWYYAAILYFTKYYHKDPRERGGLAASAIALEGFKSEVHAVDVMADAQLANGSNPEIA